MYNTIEFEREKDKIDDFLLLPKLLYDKKTYTQNEAVEREIIEETHVLNKYFTLTKLITYNEIGKVCGRCVITIYHNTDIAYIGYFECVDDAECSKSLFDKVDECVKSAGIHKILGPINTSFWIGYRLKTDHFDKAPYTGEPYNKPYYEEMFLDSGYRISEKWVSNIFKKLPLSFNKNNVYKERLKKAENKNYKLLSPSPKDFDKTLDIVYELISETFKEFTAFSEITREDFKEIFKDYKYILDYHFVKIAYLNMEPVAFSIVIPNYKNLLFGKLTLFKKIRVLLKKIRSNNYVSLYMGVKKEHRGLGKALAQYIIKNTYIRRSGCVGALITEGKITEKYGENQINDKFGYILLEKEL